MTATEITPEWKSRAGTHTAMLICPWCSGLCYFATGPLTPNVDQPKAPKFPRDKQVIEAAHWHTWTMLSDYQDSMSPAYQRDLSKYGTYILFEVINGKKVPLVVESQPKYVGMSTILSYRLAQHARGDFNSNPANHVIQEFLRDHCTDSEAASYALADRATQREFRKLAMDQRNLRVMTAHTTDKESAGRLERAMIRKYTDEGYELWNDLLYEDTE